MICSLLLLYARDSECIKNNLLQQLKGVPSYCICVDDPKFPLHQALKNPTESRLQIVFFSPGFLNFLECRPEEAYGSFRNLDPLSTVALFCCGLRENEVMCYHTAPLTSYNSWPKFEATNGEGQKNGFSPYLLQIIQEIFPNRSSITRNIVIVPEFINKESSDVYVIFPNVIKNVADLSVHIERIQITPEAINPYVIQFKVPVMLLESCQTFAVKIQQSDNVIVEKTLRIVQDSETHDDVTHRENSRVKMTSKIIMLDEQLKMLTDIGDLSFEHKDIGDREKIRTLDLEERECTMLPSADDKMRFIGMLKQYGLDDLSSFIEEPLIPDEKCTSCNNSSEQGCCVPENIKFENRYAAAERNPCTVGTPTDDVGEFSIMSRSMSLPSILPNEESLSPLYLPMEFPLGNPKFCLSQSSDAISLSESTISNAYVCMNLGQGSSNALDVCKKGLSESQQQLIELMHSFKKGNASLSDVERQFQLWQQKHREQLKPSQDNDKEDIFKYPASKEILRRTSRRISNKQASDKRKRYSGSNFENRLSRQNAWRKSSSTSASSTSPKTSEGNIHIVQTQYRKESTKLPRELSTGWIPLKKVPLNFETSPPPLPTRPRPTSRPKAEMDETSKFNRSVKRKAGTHLAPILNELVFDKPNDFEGERDGELLQSLFYVCKKYGLEHLGEFFFNEFCPCKEANLGTVKDQTLPPKNEISDMLNENTAQIFPGEWDPENNLSLRRSLSLPSTLLPTETMTVKDGKNQNYVDSQKTFAESIISRCEEYVNSIHSGIYASVLTMAGECGQNKSLKKELLSKSQQELLDLIYAFKRGDKTISQVEHQFQEWHRKHVETLSNRDQQLLKLKNQYEKAQKPLIFGIKNLWKPKKKSVKNTTPDMKQSTSKAENDSKRSSKISYTSTSSGVSDNGEAYKNMWFINPGYGELNQEASRRTSPSSKHSRCSSAESEAPPPLPPRPPLAPISFLRSCYPKFENGDMQEAEKYIPKLEAEPSPSAENQKPKLPPKPPNLFEKVRDSSLETDIEEGKDAEMPPESPDYIIPDEIRRARKKKTANRKSDASPKVKDGTEGLNILNKQVENAPPKWQVFPISNPWLKPKKTEESMFYVPRRWSSFPDLHLSDLHSEPVYLEVLDFHDSLCRSISDSTHRKN